MSATTRRGLGGALVTVALVLGGCAGDDDGADPGPSSDASEPSAVDTARSPAGDVEVHPLLVPDDRTHLGLTWFSPPEPEAVEMIDARWEEAQDAATVGRVLTDWIDVEPERGDYRTADLDEALGDLADAGLSPMVTVAAVDVSGTPFPEWLGDFDPVDAAAAYVGMIEAIEPTLRTHDVWLLAIANEPPLGDGLDLDDFATFVEEVVIGARSVAPGLAVTFTFAGPDPFVDDPAIDRMIAAVDAFSVNHYCLAADLEVEPLDVATDRIDALVDRSGDLPVVFQEFGCPAGEANGSSESDQREWFATALTHLDSIEQVRAAFVFEFLDWSESTFQLAYGSVLPVLEDEVGAEFVERFRSWLLTSGLVRADGSTRPAYDLFLGEAAS